MLTKKWNRSDLCDRNVVDTGEEIELVRNGYPTADTESCRQPASGELIPASLCMPIPEAGGDVVGGGQQVRQELVDHVL